MKRVFKTISVYNCIHIFRRILSSTGTKTIKAKAVFIVFACVVAVFSTCIKLAENKLPVEAIFIFIIIYRYSSAKVFNGNRFILIPCYFYFFTIALTSLINRV